jgi:hypothetical protein
MQGGGAFIRGLVVEEINALVAKAIAAGRTVSVAECAAKVRLRFPNCDLSDEQIADEISITAAAAGVESEPAKPSRGMPSETC